MASKEAIVAANYLADRYVVGSSMVGLFRKQEPDYVGYVMDMAPRLDDLIETSKRVMAERKTIGLPTW